MEIKAVHKVNPFLKMSKNTLFAHITVVSEQTEKTKLSTLEKPNGTMLLEMLYTYHKTVYIKLIYWF